MKRTIFAVISALLACSLFLAGCQLFREEGPPTSTEGGVLNLYGTDPHTLDPAVSGEATSHEYVVQLFNGLARLDDNMEPAPDIAEKWNISNGGKTYTFYLRRDVRFHDGRAVKAADFKYSWERACAQATGSGTAAIYLGDIVGVKDVVAGESSEISGVRVVNDYTLEVNIDAPKSYFLAKLTYPTTFVVDKANVASGREWWRHPNGTGPFKLKQWDEGSQLVLERNELFYGDKAGVSSVVFKMLAGRPMDLYENGDIDVASISQTYIDKVTDPDGPFLQELTVVTELSFSYIGFNITRPPFDDVNIRRAFSMAVDREKLVSLVFSNMVQPAYGILPPGIPGFNEGLSGLKYDIERAKQLIRESKYGDVSQLPPITLTTLGWGGSISQSLEAIIYEWRQNLGVEVKVRQLEPQRFLYHLKEEKDEMFEIGWIADYPHPQDFLEILFHSGTETNYGEYSNAEIDALLERAGLEMDSDLSLALYRQAEQRLVDDAACIPLWFGRNYVLIKPYVKSYEVNPLGFAMLNKVSIREE